MVDDASSDRTAEIALEEGARVVSVSNRQISATRNDGAAVSRGEALFFIDADTRISPAYVEGALRELARGAAGGGAHMTFEGKLPVYTRFLLPLFDLLIGTLQLSGGCCLFCRRDCFEAVGGFDTTLFAGEELRFGHALKRHGPFRLLKTRVVTSGRKLEAYSGREVLALIWHVVRRGPKALTTREGLDLWYRRKDP